MTMSRALWKGAISFGLVHIPVELHPAEQRKETSFAMLDKRDLSPVGYKRFNKKTGKEVAWEQIVKGYEYEKDRFVVLSDEDFRRANVAATQTVDIAGFVPMADIPPPYFETPYYLVPTARGKKVYALLRDTLRNTHKAAVAQVVIRTTPHLAALFPDGPMLMLNTLRYADELRSSDELDVPAESPKTAGVSARETELARKLVDDMSEKWNPNAFVNTYTRDLHRRIDEKIRRGETEVITEPDSSTEAPRSADIIDLTTLLKRSLDAKNVRTGAKRAVKAGEGSRGPGRAKISRHAASPRPAAAKRRRA